MAPPKKLPRTEEAALQGGQQLLKALWGIKRKGRPKKRGNLASDTIVVVSARAARNKTPALRHGE
jgi:hypothetical protein